MSKAKQKTTGKKQSSSAQVSSTESSDGSVLPLEELVKLIRCDIKDAKRKDKINGIVMYSIQEALKTSNKVEANDKLNAFKDEQFRALVVRLIEASLRYAGYLSTIVVLGNKFAYEAKNSKNTLAIYQIGKAPNPLFHIMCYDLAYINVPSIRLSSNQEYHHSMNKLKQGLKVKEGELLCPNKVITTMEEIVCDE